MYIGRFVIAGRTAQGRPYLGYRVSSRSFPNRAIVLKADRAVVVPTADAAPGTVVLEHGRGFTLNERLVRPAMVGVAVALPQGSPGGGGAD